MRELLRSLTKSERCERISQVAHQKLATMSDLLRSLTKNKRFSQKTSKPMSEFPALLKLQLRLGMTLRILQNLQKQKGLSDTRKLSNSQEITSKIHNWTAFRENITEERCVEIILFTSYASKEKVQFYKLMGFCPSLFVCRSADRRKFILMVKLARADIID